MAHALVETPHVDSHADATARPAFSGDVVCEIVDGQSALTRVRATDPLKLLTPRNHGQARHVVLSSYGGGLVGGDCVSLQATVGPRARLLLTTQSAGKAYRTTGPACEHLLHATVGEDALLAVLPDPMCCFAESRYRQRQHYDVSATGSLVLLDWLTSGRHGRGERWAMHAIDSRTEIGVDGRSRLIETLSLDAADGAIGSMMRVGGFDCYATLILLGPLVGHCFHAAKAYVRGLPLSPSPAVLAADATLSGGAVFRLLGRDAQTVQGVLRVLLSPLDDLLGQNPWGRKW